MSTSTRFCSPPRSLCEAECTSAADTPVNDPVTSSFTTAYACQAGHEAPGSQRGTLAQRLWRETPLGQAPLGRAASCVWARRGRPRARNRSLCLRGGRPAALPTGRLSPFRRCTFSAETELNALTCTSRKVSVVSRGIKCTDGVQRPSDASFLSGTCPTSQMQPV